MIENEITVMVDYTKPSTEERLFIVDLEKKQLLISSLVTHDRGTGDLYAINFLIKILQKKKNMIFQNFYLKPFR